MPFIGPSWPPQGWQLAKSPSVSVTPRALPRNAVAGAGKVSHAVFSGTDASGRFVRSTGRSARYAAAVVILLLVNPSLSFAQGHQGTPQEQAACRRDGSRFCRQQLADDFAVQQCLLQNRARLSHSCQKVFQSHGMQGWGSRVSARPAARGAREMMKDRELIDNAQRVAAKAETEKHFARPCCTMPICSKQPLKKNPKGGAPSSQE